MSSNTKASKKRMCESDLNLTLLSSAKPRQIPVDHLSPIEDDESMKNRKKVVEILDAQLKNQGAEDPW